MEIIKKNKESYDNFPYKSKAYDQTNPNRLKVIASVLGLKAKELNRARVLEIGCSYGGNIIPFAIGYEGAEVYGIDLSETQINKGKEIVKEIGLKNVHLHSMNIMDYKEEFGKFDYIICHGVYSWVPDEVKFKILEVIKKSLDKNGVAHISYNTYPGWKSLDIFRDSMLFRKNILERQGFQFNEEDTVRAGKGMVEFLKDNAYLGEATKARVDEVISANPYYIYHEYFEYSNDPQYLYEFNEKLEEYGLRHIADTSISKSLIPDKYKEILERECGNDIVAKEQYMDYIRNSQFRNSIIVHKENMDNLKNVNELKLEDFKKYYVRQKIIKTEDETSIGKILKEIYPKNIQMEKLVENEEVDKGELITKIASVSLEISDEPVNIKKVKKPRLKPLYKKYIEIVSQGDSSPIVLANKYGICFENSLVEYQMMLQFDGKNTIEDVIDIFKRKLKKGEINVTLGNDETRTEEDVIEDFVKGIEDMLYYNEFFAQK